MPYTEVLPFEPGSDNDLHDRNRPGFIVVGPRSDCSLLAYEGFYLGEQDGEYLVEHDLVELARIDSPADLGGKGIGRALMQGAAEEARRRGYDRLRLSAHNARIISNLTRLVEGQVLRSVEYFYCPSSEKVPSDWLPALGNLLSDDEGRDFINADPHTKSDGFSPSNYVAALVQL